MSDTHRLPVSWPPPLRGEERKAALAALASALVSAGVCGERDAERKAARILAGLESRGARLTRLQ